MNEEKTESPTTKKLRDARKKGQVASSKEIISTALIISITFTLIGMADYWLRHINQLILVVEKSLNLPFAQALKEVSENLFWELLYICLPVLSVAAAAVVVSHLAQFGFLFSSQALTPDVNKINPVEGAKKIFSLKNLVEFIKSIVKVVFLSLLVWMIIQGNIASLLNITACGIDCIMPVTGAMIKQMITLCALCFIIIAIVDYAFERHQYLKELRMSKDEVKREHKEIEGNPQIKTKRRQLHQELQNSDMRTSVKRSSLIVANPTHIAVGLRYLKGETPLPVITLKYTQSQALRVRKIAEEEGIPVLLRIPLARALYQNGSVDNYIPADLIDAVAEVLHWLASLNQEADIS